MDRTKLYLANRMLGAPIGRVRTGVHDTWQNLTPSVAAAELNGRFRCTAVIRGPGRR